MIPGDGLSHIPLGQIRLNQDSICGLAKRFGRDGGKRYQDGSVEDSIRDEAAAEVLKLA